MLYTTTTASQRRRRLRERLSSGDLLRIPGAFNPLSARLVERHGFDGVYVSGAVVSADLALPDIGLTTLSEVAGRSRQIARVTDLPVITDADTGFGEPLNVARTVQELEDTGVAGLHVEDQVNPKRCGHLDGKQVVDADEAARRVYAAATARRDPDLLLIARTDVRAVAGVEATAERARRYVDAGADAIFPEALTRLEEYEVLRRAVDVPLLANMTEFGKTPLFTTRQLADVGVNLVIWPVSLLRLAMGAAEEALSVLAREGTLGSMVPRMQHRSDLYDLIDYAGYTAFDDAVLFEESGGTASGR